jgi:parallel beta-helix repeat protein
MSSFDSVSTRSSVSARSSIFDRPAAHSSRTVALTGTLALGALLSSFAVQAATLRVPTQYPDIQSAINAAANGDTVLVANGVYFGPNNQNLDTHGKAIKLTSMNGPTACTIDGSSAQQLLSIQNGETSKTVISGFTFEAGAGNNGAAIFINGASPTISNCVFQNNVATYGGAIGNNGGSPVISGCIFRNNQAAYGGAIFVNQGQAQISGSTFSNNTSQGYGGALYLLQDKTRLKSCVLTDNSAYDGGALMFDGGSTAGVSSCTVEDNTASNLGGGMFINASSPHLTGCDFLSNTAVNGGSVEVDDSSPVITTCGFYYNTASSTSVNEGGGAIRVTTTSVTSAPIVNSSTFFDNTGLDGGAILSSGNTTVNGCIFLNNTATYDGGALDGLAGKPVIVNSVFIGNGAQDFVGGALRFLNAGTAATVTNCSFSYNSAPNGSGGDGVYVDTGASVGIYNSILWDSTDATLGREITDVDGTATIIVKYSDVYGGYVGKGNLDTDPLYANVGSGELALQSGSPCIDAASPSVPYFPKTDINGVLRNRKTPTMGATE